MLALVATVPDAQLQASILGNDVLLSWPSEITDYRLETTTNLAEQESWLMLPSVPTVINSQNVVTNPVDGGNHFYRLKHE